MSKMVENRTMATVLEELNNSVNKYNAETDPVVKVKLALEHKKLAEEYNALSLLSSYAKFMADETPLVALAKAYYYDVVSVKDTAHNEADENGVMKSSITRSVKNGVKKFDVVKFIEWAKEANKVITAGNDWKTKVEGARKAVETEWKKFFAAKGDSHAMSIGKTKKALQAMFDSLVFIPCENDKEANAIIANGDVAKWVLGFANTRKDGKVDGNVVITGNVLPAQSWRTLLLDIMHKAVTGKTYEIVYGDAEDDAKDNAEADAKGKSKGKSKDNAEDKADAQAESK